MKEQYISFWEEFAAYMSDGVFDGEEEFRCSKDEFDVAYAKLLGERGNRDDVEFIELVEVIHDNRKHGRVGYACSR